MPGDDLTELVSLKVFDSEPAAQLLRIVAGRQMSLEAVHAIAAVAVDPIKVVDLEAVQSPFDPPLDPGLQHPAPVGVGQAAPIDGVRRGVLIETDVGRPIPILGQELQGVRHRFRAQLLLVPELFVELEKTVPGPARLVRPPQQVLGDVEVSDGFHSALLELTVELLEVVAAQPDPLGGVLSLDHPGMDGQQGAGDALVLVREMGDGPEVGAVEADLGDLRLGLPDEIQVAGFHVPGPVDDHPGELEALGIAPGGFGGRRSGSAAGRRQGYGSDAKNQDKGFGMRIHHWIPAALGSGYTILDSPARGLLTSLYLDS